MMEQTIFATTQNAAGREAGIYSVIVDADNVTPCLIDNIIVSEPPLLEILK